MARLLENWLQAYKEYTRDTEPPELFKSWVGMSVICAGLQRKCRLSLGNLFFYPNMYVLLVAPPGKCRKGMAMSQGEKILRSFPINMVTGSITREALLKKMASKKSTSEGFGDGVPLTHTSFTIFSHEFTVFFRDKDTRMMDDLCHLWDNPEDTFENETKNKGSDYIDHPWINLVAATTPSRISIAMPEIMIGGGFSSRAIILYKNTRENIIPIPITTPEQEKQFESLVHDFGEIYNMSGTFRPTKDFEKLWAPWYINQTNNPPFTSENLSHYCERRASNVLKLCMVMSAARGNSFEVTADDLIDAVAAIEEAEKTMPEAFGGVGANPIAGKLHKVQLFISFNKEVTLKELYTQFMKDISNQEMSEIITTLQSTDFLTYDGNSKTIKLKENK